MSFYFILAFLGIIAFTFLFKKEKTFPKLLRICSFFLILACIFEPLLELTLKKKPWLLVLIDTSKSMGVGERLKEVKQILPEIKLKKKIYGFDAHPYPINRSDSQIAPTITTGGELTNIGNALLETPAPSAYLLLSDGINNAGPDPIEIAQRKGIPIYTIGIGDSIPKDIRISNLTYNKISYTKDHIPIKVTLENMGYKQQHIQVLLKENNRILLKKKVLLPQNGMQEEVELSVVSGRAGTHFYEANISILPDEIDKENNKREFGIHILKSRIKVGWFGESPSWNFKFAKLEFAQDSRIDFNWWVKIGEEKWLSRDGINNAPDFQSVSPQTYDAIILENFEYPQIERLLDKGTGVIIIGKTCTHISPLILGSETKESKYPIKVIDSFLFNRKELPPLKEIYKVKGVKGSARIECATSEGKPLIAKMQYGDGMAVAIAAKDIWRWNFKPEIKFWNKLIRLITIRRELSPLMIETEPVYEIGEKIIFRAQAYTPDYKPDPNSKITIKVCRDTIYPAQFGFDKPNPNISESISLYSLGDGKYEEAIDFLSPGKYKYKASTPKGGYAEGEFLVTSNIELQELASDRAFLRTLSQVSGGKYINDIKDLDIKLKPRTSRVPLNPGQYWLSILLIVLLLSAEWLILRR